MDFLPAVGVLAGVCAVVVKGRRRAVKTVRVGFMA
jgi:hypothetical protein